MTQDIKDDDGPADADLHDIRVRRDSPAAGTRDAFLDLRNSLSAELRQQRGSTVDLDSRSQVRAYVHEQLDGLLGARGIVLNRSEKRQLMEAIVAELSGS